MSLSAVEFAACMGYLATATGKPMPTDAAGNVDAAMSVYLDLLGDLDRATLVAACRAVALRHVWATFPTPAEIRQAAVSALTAGQPDAWQAWAMVCRIIADFGMPQGEDKKAKLFAALAALPPAVRDAVDALGYRNLARSENSVADRAHFQRAYESRLKHTTEQLLLAPALRSAALPGQNGRAALPGQVSGLLANIGRDVMPPVVDNTKKKC